VYSRRLVLLLRERFDPGLTQRTPANLMAMRRFLVQHMVEHGVHVGDRARVIEKVLFLFFIPTDEDMLIRRWASDLAVEQRFKQYQTDYVDYGFQRFTWFFKRKSLYPAIVRDQV
jgi:hypothetical protein